MHLIYYVRAIDELIRIDDFVVYSKNCIMKKNTFKQLRTPND